MARIVHLSDLHLGKPDDWQLLADDKTGLLRRGATTTQTVLADTIRAFGQAPDAADVDAVVISGDITNRAREDGYQKLEDLTRLLPDSLSPSETLIVPGNHDVVWDAQEGSRERYRHWLTYVRERGFATPLLDGIDFDENGRLLPDDGHRRPVLEGDDFVVVALNSSNFCGVLEGATDVDWDSVLRFKLRQRKPLRDAIKSLRQHDLAQISGSQIRALRELFTSDYPALLDPKADDRIRIAVLHHHLLPVSTREEVKTFESIVNLGEVRMFLRDLGVHVVLHGHKHHSGLYFDYPPEPATPLGPGARRMLVVASPGIFRPREPTFRMLDTRPRASNKRGSRTQTTTAPLLDIREVPGLRSVEPFSASSPQTVDLWRSEMEMTEGPFTAIYGRTRDEVYERLQSRFEGVKPGTEIGNLVCVVQSPVDDDESRLPSGYPPVSGEDEEAWFSSLVDWWQREESHVIGRSKTTAFNHGERIYGPRWGNSETDSVRRAAQVLHDEPDTTRSIIVLVDPRLEAGRLDCEFPAFVVIQLRLVQVGADLRLNCLGYFRKQDIRHWWPLNVAELARIQRRATAYLREAGTEVLRGHVITFAAVALVDDRLPVLDIARIDRALDDEEDAKQLWRMAYAIFHPDEVRVADALELWDSMLRDLEGGNGETGPGRKIATVGLDELQNRLMDLRAVTSDTATGEVVQLVEAVRHSFRILDAGVPDAVREDHLTRLDADIARLREAVQSRLNLASSPKTEAEGSAVEPSDASPGPDPSAAGAAP